VSSEDAVRPDGTFVLYWMIAARRCRSNFGLQRAVEWARELDRPLLVFEALRAGYPWASDRLHAFVAQGMADNAAALGPTPVGYYPYVEPEPGAGSGLLAALASEAAVVVTDDFPAFFLPRMIAAAGRTLSVRLEAVDGNGLLPMASLEQVFPTAYALRRVVHRVLGDDLSASPDTDPLAGPPLRPFAGVPTSVAAQWPVASAEILDGEPSALGALPIDHAVGVVEDRGGSAAAARCLDRFIRDRLPRYAESRNVPDEQVTSELSPYLHFGHISAHEVFWQVADWANWTPERLRPEDRGSRSGWGMREGAADFADQIVTWRELGYNMCHHRDDYMSYASLPDWARVTLAEHAADPRPHRYDLDTFAAGETHDRLWNAAQNQLRTEGRLHNYLRMLWAKKILEWSDDPETALSTMIALNDRYALDGRNPNSYSGICWTLGRYDRAWGPERPIFGKIRYMSSANTARKVRVKDYLERYAPEGG
jgi:deoxyribodipyrimidine photo-lyase